MSLCFHRLFNDNKTHQDNLETVHICEQQGYIWKSNTLLLGLKGGKKPFIFDLYKIIIFSSFAIQNETPMNYRFTWQQCTCKPSALIRWEMMQSYLMQVESSSLLEKSFKHKASHGQENESCSYFSSNASFRCEVLNTQENWLILFRANQFPYSWPQLSSSVEKTAQAQQQSCYPMTILVFGRKDWSRKRNRVKKKIKQEYICERNHEEILE